jgi:16S rRNA processing protein RimM
VPEPASEGRFVTVARLVRPQGNRGELAAEMESDDAGIFKLFPEVQLWDGGSRREAVHVRNTWPHKNRLILKFDGIDTIDQARRVAGWQVQIPAEQRPPAPAGRFYVDDLIGCAVVERRSGRRLGEVSGLVETGAVPLVEVKAGNREILIPFAWSICVEVDPEQRVIRVELPEGLEEL